MAIDIGADNINNESHNNSTDWDNIVSCFSEADLHNSNYTPSKDNFEAVWPVLYQVICDQLSWTQSINRRACDFGCGTGQLADQLSKIDFHMFACDTSKEMIAQARLSSHENIVYGVDSVDFVKKYSPFKLITAIMVFQFIADFDLVIDTLVQCLDEDGLLFFAIHHIDYVCKCIEYGVKFRGIKNNEFPTAGEILIDTHWIKTYIRSPEWYNDVLSSKGLVRDGYLLNGNTPPLGLSEKERIEWRSLKYYIAWYKKKS